MNNNTAQDRLSPHWDIWRNVTTATRFELVMLAHNIDPNYLGGLGDGLFRNSPLAQFLERTGLDAKLDLAYREFHIPSVLYVSGMEHTEKGSCAKFAEWAEGLNPPWILPDEFPRGSRQALNTPSRNQPSHPCYAAELAIACEAWAALYADSRGEKPKQGHKKQIEKWLSEHYQDISNAARERITTLVNPNKDGGAPSTE